MCRGVKLYTRSLCTKCWFPSLKLVLVALLLVFLVVFVVVVSSEPDMDLGDGRWTDFWVVRLSLNLAGYATIVIPGLLLIRWVKSSGYLDKAAPGCLPNLIRSFVYGSEEEKASLEEAGKVAEVPKQEESWAWKIGRLIFCTAGLQGSYLIWGLLQERIMSIEYGGTETEPGENFKNSQFLVFMNRILAFCLGLMIILTFRYPKHKAPLYKYSFSSFSNIMSSWCQYEALKFVSFPTQVLAKASKIIPVMLMGKMISKRSYQYYEYITAVMISLGVSMFLLTSQDTVKDDNTVTTFSGVVILIGYLLFDAFTSNWQGELFTQYKMSSMQMMVGVNFFSVLFTSVTLIEQGGFVESVAFMGRHSAFMFHVLILSICSASGQLFIFYTISHFGAVTFAIIMTIRQGLAILLSCIFYQHPVTIIGVLGVLIVFSAIFLRIYCNQIAKRAAKQGESAKATVAVPPPKA